jgi:hypothetical protein
LAIFEAFDDSAFRYLNRFVVADARHGPLTFWEVQYPCKNIGAARERLCHLLDQSQWAVDKADADKKAAKAAADSKRQAKSEAAANKASDKLAATKPVKTPKIDKFELFAQQVREELAAQNEAALKEAVAAAVAEALAAVKPQKARKPNKQAAALLA